MKGWFVFIQDYHRFLGDRLVGNPDVVARWEFQISELLRRDVSVQEIEDAVRWAIRARQIDPPDHREPTPETISGWVRQMNAEARERAGATAQAHVNESAREEGARVIRAWLAKQNGRSEEEMSGYRFLSDTDKELGIEPTDEYLSATTGQWRTVGEHCFRFATMRRKLDPKKGGA